MPLVSIHEYLSGTPNAGGRAQIFGSETPPPSPPLHMPLSILECCWWIVRSLLFQSLHHKAMWLFSAFLQLIGSPRIMKNWTALTLYMYLDLQTASNSSKIIRWSPLLSPNWRENKRSFYYRKLVVGNVTVTSMTWVKHITILVEIRISLALENYSEGEKDILCRNNVELPLLLNSLKMKCFLIII